ncbi:MAG: hypothetical protein ACYTF0_04000 [Planctomycetota bacterium]|jgi:hypothetical protein
MSDHPWHVRITTVDGRHLLWHKGGQVHQLRAELGPTWVANFKPALFQALPDGSFVPRGSDPRAVDVIRVELEAAPVPDQA